MVICDFFLSLHSPHPVNHQILLTPPPKSVQGPVPALHPQCPWLTSDQSHLPGIVSQLPKESSCISSLQSFYWYPDLIWLYPITAQSLKHSPLSKLTVSLEVRSLLKVYLNFFWPHRAACEILVSRPGIKPRSLAGEVWSPNHWTAGEFLFLNIFNKVFYRLGFLFHVIVYVSGFPVRSELFILHLIWCCSSYLGLVLYLVSEPAVSLLS